MAEKMKKQQAKEKKELMPYRAGRMPSFIDEMERMFEDLMGRGFGQRLLPSFRWPEFRGMTFPSVDVFDSDKEVTVKAELPGVSKEDLNVSVTEDAVTISGEKKKEEKVEEKNYYRMERSFGSFSRTVLLPAEVQSSKAKASFKNGTLEIKVPKKEASKKVKINVE